MQKDKIQPGELGAEPAELEVAGTELGATAIKDQLADIRDKGEKQKIPLSKEVEDYTRENLRKVAGKLQAGEPVYPSDMAFIEKVKLWMAMPEILREKYKSIEGMGKMEEVKEARRRSITLQQWFGMLNMASFKLKKRGKEKKWIGANFTFPGGGEIKTDRDLDLHGCIGLTSLPANLQVDGTLSLHGCTGLTSLPYNLKVSGYLDLSGCTGLTSLPDDLEVGVNLNLNGCIALTSLPDNLKVYWDLDLSGCTGLTSLPDNLKIGRSFYLGENCNKQVKRDAERLKSAGKINGEIKYE
jgi:hypothetical protein